MKKNILYLGDSPLGGASTYLYCVLRYLGHTVIHLDPAQKLTPKIIKKSNPHLIILSDYPHHNLKSCTGLIQKKVEEGGVGLLMVGGWGSFQGGGYRNTQIASLLPVKIKAGDDRLNYSPGLRVVPTNKDSLWRPLEFRNGPMICGLNKVVPKRFSLVELEARALHFNKSTAVSLSQKKEPLLVTSRAGKGRVACFMTDFAPHWAGGLLDWGSKRILIRNRQKRLVVEVGNSYIKLIQQIVSKCIQKDKTS